MTCHRLIESITSNNVATRSPIERDASTAAAVYLFNRSTGQCPKTNARFFALSPCVSSNRCTVMMKNSTINRALKLHGSYLNINMLSTVCESLASGLRVACKRLPRLSWSALKTHHRYHWTNRIRSFPVPTIDVDEPWKLEIRMALPANEFLK